MKKLLFVTLLSLIFLSSFVIAQTSQETRQCKISCNLDYRQTTVSCNQDYRTCNTDCRSEFKSCISQFSEEKTSCVQDCFGEFTIRKEINSCLQTCSSQFNQHIKESCNQKECRNSCKTNRVDCRVDARETRNSCKLTCIGEESTPTNKRNKHDFSISRGTCEDAGGFYQQLCKGPFFGIVCTQQKYCHCAGFSNFSCPADYSCIENHEVEIRGRGFSIPGFRDLRGTDLGPIGLCAKN